MHTTIRLAGICILATVSMGKPWAQTQTNVSVYGKSEPDTVITPVTPKTTRLRPPPTVVVPASGVVTSGDTLISKGAYTPPDTASTVGAIPPDQINVLQRRREAKRFGTFGFGPANFNNVETKDQAYDAYVGTIWEVNRNAAVKALGEVASDFHRSTIADLNLGANLYALPTDISPYIGADLGLSFGSVPGDRAFGMNAGASIGVLLFRTSSVQMNLEGNAQMMFFDLNHDRPYIYSARLGVLL